MTFLSAWLLSTWFAEIFCPSDYLVFHGLLAWRSAAVAGILLGLLVFGQTLFNPNRSLGRLMYNFNNCLQSFAFYKASFARF